MCTEIRGNRAIGRLCTTNDATAATYALIPGRTLPARTSAAVVPALLALAISQAAHRILGEIDFFGIELAAGKRRARQHQNNQQSFHGSHSFGLHSAVLVPLLGHALARLGVACPTLRTFAEAAAVTLAANQATIAARSVVAHVLVRTRGLLPIGNVGPLLVGFLGIALRILSIARRAAYLAGILGMLVPVLVAFALYQAPPIHNDRVVTLLFGLVALVLGTLLTGGKANAGTATNVAFVQAAFEALTRVAAIIDAGTLCFAIVTKPIAAAQPAISGTVSARFRFVGFAVAVAAKGLALERRLVAILSGCAR